MRIALTVDPYLPVPPLHYGGIERIVDFLARGLVDRGHDVTLFAHPESRSSARLIPYGVPPHRGVSPRLRELIQVGSGLWQLRRDVDVIHSFGRLAALAPVLARTSLPKIQSYQRAISPASIRRALSLAGDSLQFTACSTSMYAGRELGGRWTTIFNGVDLSSYEAVAKVPADAPLIFLGRMERIKGPHHAVAIAKASHRRLILMGNKVCAPEDPHYFERELAPAIDGEQIAYVGEVDDEQKGRLLGVAAALLMPIEWDEPFGIVMAEAMACGTPVVAFDRGSVSEVVRDGINGFRCKDVSEAVQAVRRLGELDRSMVRADASARFSADAIVDAYERLYERALASTSKRSVQESTA